MLSVVKEVISADLKCSVVARDESRGSSGDSPDRVLFEDRVLDGRREASTPRLQIDTRCYTEPGGSVRISSIDGSSGSLNVDRREIGVVL